MDLHLTSDQATDAEKSAVDHELGSPQSGWEGGKRTAQSDGHSAIRTPVSRDMLLPVLHAVNSRIGWISRGTINYIALRMNLRLNLWRGILLRHVFTPSETSYRCPRVRRHRLHDSWRSKPLRGNGEKVWARGIAGFVWPRDLAQESLPRFMRTRSGSIAFQRGRNSRRPSPRARFHRFHSIQLECSGNRAYARHSR